MFNENWNTKHSMLDGVWLRAEVLVPLGTICCLTYSDEALQIALDNNLTIMGTSDIHGLVDWQFGIPEGGHRPVTIVLAKEKTPEGIKEGLMAGRTIAYFKDMLIGKEENVVPLIQASLTVEKAEYQAKADIVTVTIKNHTGVPFILANLSAYTFHGHSDILTIPPYKSFDLIVKTKERLDAFSLPFKVMNGIIAPNTHPNIRFAIEAE